jgi:methyltransferase-like protein/2-polyprenyl-3-methyl-5-hydroxy-6-metoxy-1,4-benzoquinol methylase
MSTSTYRYDEVPYSFHAFKQTHPDRLATIARMFGMATPTIESCRVLELGCGRGGNLLPMAEQLPGSRFVGVELSEVQANEAISIAERMGLDNIEIRHANILDVDDSWGQFDYIIAHGVYSWVPREVQDKILEISKRNLSVQGIAYVSYNVNPGWHMRGMLRDMMVYHASRFETPHQRIQQARGLLDFVAKNTSDKTPYGMFLKTEVDMLRSQEDEYLYHEHLSDFNDPIYFYQFAARCESDGLQYVGESEMASMYLGHFSPEIIATLEQVASDYVQMEQYLDFIRNRMFRQSLLTHSGIPIDRSLKPQLLPGMYVSSSLKSNDPIEGMTTQAPWTFTIPGTQGQAVISYPFTKAVLHLLGQAAPGRVEYQSLLEQARALADSRTVVPRNVYEEENNETGRTLLRFYVNGVLDFHTTDVCFATNVPDKPTASRLSRIQAERGNVVTSLVHAQVRLNELEQSILPLLDGTRTSEDITAALQGKFEDRFVAIGGERGAPPLSKVVNDALDRFAGTGLLLR